MHQMRRLLKGLVASGMTKLPLETTKEISKHDPTAARTCLALHAVKNKRPNPISPSSEFAAENMQISAAQPPEPGLLH